MSENFVSIGLQNPKSATNVASVLRAAGCYGVNSVFYTGNRYRYAKEYNADTRAMHKVIPTVGVEELLEMAPKDTVKIAIELAEGAMPLPDYHHPPKAYYLFGPEDASLDQQVINRCDAVLYIPTRGSMNLAATVNVVLYDRLLKLQQFDRSSEFLTRTRDNNNRLKVAKF